MHGRAKAAGMYEYGASPEQMHYVPHVPPGAPAIENTWQQAWRTVRTETVSRIPTPRLYTKDRTSL